jgi:hypothetical protein
MGNIKNNKLTMYRIGRKQKRALMDKNGHEVALFEKGKEELAQSVCDFLNGTNWISVEDRLPEEKQVVLTYGYDGNDVLQFLDGEFYHYEDGYERHLNITHWMPLPKPPTP